MGLVTCPDCGASVSDAAPACVKCGRPRGAPTSAPSTKPPAPAKSSNCGGKLLGCFVLLVLMSALGRSMRPPGGYPPPPPANSPPTQTEEPKAESSPVLPGEKGELRSGKGSVTVAVSEEAMSKLHEVLNDNDDVGLRRLIAAGLVAQVPDGTRVLALSGGPGVFSGLRRVRILEGANAGQEVVVPYEYLKR